LLPRDNLFPSGAGSNSAKLATDNQVMIKRTSNRIASQQTSVTTPAKQFLAGGRVEVVKVGPGHVELRGKGPNAGGTPATRVSGDLYYTTVLPYKHWTLPELADALVRAWPKQFPR
jgi:hypothetical protein